MTDTVWDDALDALMRWLIHKWPGLEEMPSFDQLDDSDSVEIAHPETPQLRLVTLTDEDRLTWQFQLTQPDPSCPGRVWVTQARLHELADSLECYVQNGYSPDDQDERVVPTSPFFVRDLALLPGSHDEGHPLQLDPLYVDSPGTFDVFESLLFSSHRRLPVLVLTTTRAHHVVPMSAQILAKHLIGLAHVVVLEGQTTFWLSQDVGEGLSAFNGGSRLYLPGFTAEAAQDDHPLFIPPQVVRTGERTTHGGYQAFVRGQAFEAAMAALPPLQLLEQPKVEPDSPT